MFTGKYSQAVSHSGTDHIQTYLTSAWLIFLKISPFPHIISFVASDYPPHTALYHSNCAITRLPPQKKIQSMHIFSFPYATNKHYQNTTEKQTSCKIVFVLMLLHISKISHKKNLEERLHKVRPKLLLFILSMHLWISELRERGIWMEGNENKLYFVQK